MIAFLIYIGNMKKRIIQISVIAIIAAILLLSLFLVYPALTKKETAKAEGVGGILRIWHIDTFEGGKGSRASFLESAARRFEKKNKKYLFMITTHTVSSAKIAIENGELPDALSFGTGGAICPESFLPLEKYNVPSARQDGKTLAVPWGRGGYFLFTCEGDFTDISAENTVILEGNFSLSKAAAAAESLPCATVRNSLSAYLDFVNGKYKYLLGTQRDVARLQTRGVQFTAKPMGQFCDIYQYFAVLAEDIAKYNACLDYLSLLLSESMQKDLTKIGMLSPYNRIYDENNTPMRDAEQVQPVRTVSAFLEEQSYEAMKDLADAALRGDQDSLKKLKNFFV